MDTNNAETVRALLAERRRSQQNKGDDIEVADSKKSRIQALLAQRRNAASRAQSNSPKTAPQQLRDAELLSPDSSMSFEFPVDASPTSTARAEPRPVPGRAHVVGSVPTAAVHQADHIHAERARSAPSPHRSLPQPTAAPATSPAHPKQIFDPTKHLSPVDQATWLEIQDAIGVEDDVLLPSHSHVVPTRASPIQNNAPPPDPHPTARSHTPSASRKASNAGPQAWPDEDVLRVDLPSMPTDTATAKNTTRAGQQAPQQGSVRPTMAELEMRLALAMGNLHVGPDGHAVAGGNGGGPFDISELWMGQASASHTQSEQSTGHTDAYGDEAQSRHHTTTIRPHTRSTAPHTQRHTGKAPSANTSRRGSAAGHAAAAAAAAAHKQTSRALFQPQMAAGARPATAGPRTRGRSQSPRVRPRSESLSGTVYAQPGTQTTPTLLVANPQDFTFKPKINERSREMVRDSYPVHREHRIEQLAVPKTVLLQKYEEVRAQQEEHELRECTFRPRTGRAPSPARVQRGGPVHDRLYAQRPTWVTKREQLLEQRERESLADCTFKPQINTVSQRRAASAGRAPLHMRVQEVLRNKNETLSNARIRKEMADQGITFQPSVNPRSVQLAARVQAEQGLQGVAAGERLYHEAMMAKRSPRQDLLPEEAECTFAPQINERSKRLVATSQEIPGSFLERQAFLAALTAEKRALYANALEEAERRPQRYGSQGRGRRGEGQSSNETSGTWGGQSGSDDLECGGDRIAKLAYADVRRSAALKEALTRHHYSQYTFTPEINPRSRVIGKTHTVDDLYRNAAPAGRHAKSLVARTVATEELSECTFTPALNPVSLRTAERLKQSGSLLDTLNAQQLLQERAAKLQEARALKVYEELRDCTFTPEVNKGKPATTKKVDITHLPGVASFLDNVDLAKRKAEEEKRRQEQVWWQKPQGPRHLFTVPQPFSFEERQRQRQLEDEELVYGAQAAAPVKGNEQLSLRNQGVRRSQQSHALTVRQVLEEAEALEATLARPHTGHRHDSAHASAPHGDVMHTTLRLKA